MISKKWLFVSSALSLFVAGCSNEPQTKSFEIEKMFTQTQPTTLGVSTVDIFNEAQSTTDSSFDIFFTEDVEKWARKRFKPVGDQGHGVIKITELSIKEHEGKVCGTLVTPSKDEYLASLTIRVSVNNAMGFEKSYVENTVKRSTFVPTNITLIERENAVRKLITDVIVEMDAQLAKNIKNHLSYTLS